MQFEQGYNQFGSNNGRGHELNTNGAIVLVAKTPIAGKSKTRLAKNEKLGDEGAAKLARAMLTDTIERVGRCSAFKKVLKILLYAPTDKESEEIMKSILSSVRPEASNNKQDAFNIWMLMPMEDGSRENLTSSNLGDKLKNALFRVRHLIKQCRRDELNAGEDGGVVFIGMDSPDLSLNELQNGLLYSSPPHNQAFICPSEDGGYGLISIPPCAPLQVFDGVRWSSPLTATSQIKSLSDWNQQVVMGKMMYDVDEIEDVVSLSERLCKVNLPKAIMNNNTHSHNDVLQRRSSPPVGAIGLSETHFQDENFILCQNTWQLLREFGFLDNLEKIPHPTVIPLAQRQPQET